MSKLALALRSMDRTTLLSRFPTMMSSIDLYLPPLDWADDEAGEAAWGIASLLSDLIHSSDIDCEYYPCVLEGPEPGTSAFYEALGITKEARQRVGGYDNPKVAVKQAGKGKGKASGLSLISGLGDAEVKAWREYMDADEKGAIEEAFKKLAAHGPVYGINLCADDGAHRILFTVAYADERCLGIVTVRQET